METEAADAALEAGGVVVLSRQAGRGERPVVLHRDRVAAVGAVELGALARGLTRGNGRDDTE